MGLKNGVLNLWGYRLWIHAATSRPSRPSPDRCAHEVTVDVHSFPVSVLRSTVSALKSPVFAHKSPVRVLKSPVGPDSDEPPVYKASIFCG